MVVDEKQVRSVVTADGGLFDLMEPGQTVVVHSTVTPGAIQDIAAVAASQGIGFVDAPVSGARPAANGGR